MVEKLAFVLTVWLLSQVAIAFAIRWAKATGD
jgi:hypothetical protein